MIAVARTSGTRQPGVKVCVICNPVAIEIADPGFVAPHVDAVAKYSWVAIQISFSSDRGIIRITRVPGRRIEEEAKIVVFGLP
jgi:hypothetical protein